MEENNLKISLALYIRLEFRPRYQVSVYRTIGPLINYMLAANLGLLLYGYVFMMERQNK